MYYYKQDTGRTTLESLKRYYGIETNEQALEAGYIPLDISTPPYNNFLQAVVDKGTIVEGDKARINWEVINLPLEEVEKRLVPYLNKEVENYMDRVAKAKGYDNRVTCSLRAGFDGPFKEEGAQFAAWMDTCFATLYTVMEKATKGEIDIPTSFSQLLPHLPTPPWPPKEERKLKLHPFDF